MGNNSKTIEIDKKRFRTRMEYNGIEVFDRWEGRVLTSVSKLTKEVTNHAERIINTPYPKSSKFTSAPRRIYWELTRKCNLNCKSCFNRTPASLSELSYSDILTLAKQFYKGGVYELRLSGGEPTERDDFFKITEALHNMGFYLSMGSNGSYSKTTLERVMCAPIDFIIISLDGANEDTHDEIRGRGNFRKVLKNLEILSTKGCRFRINTLIRKTNYKYEHLKGLAELCDSLNIESLNCIPLRPVTNDPATLQLQLSKEEFKVFISALNRLRNEHNTDFVTSIDLRHTSTNDRVYYKDKSCAAGREGAVVSPYGEIYGCSYSPASTPEAPKELREKYVAGNLLEKDFLDIWNQKNGWEIFRDLDKYKHENCKICSYYKESRCIGNCPIMDINNPAAFDPYCYLAAL
jgi:radical SAM protein with 4Fe4S-binding SPASM domain